jgi:hypothetical protein
MKLKLKLIAAAIALVAASGANAGITVASAGNGELFFTIYDIGADSGSSADDRLYVRDLGFGSLVNGVNIGAAINNWVSATTTAPLPLLEANKQGFGTIFSVAADTSLASFISATGTPNLSRLQWNIVAGDTSGSDRILTTANSVISPNYSDFRTISSKVDVFLGTGGINVGLGANESAVFSGAAASLNLWGDKFGSNLPQFSNAAGLGASQGFFVLSERLASGSTTTIADVRQYMADGSTAMQWTLENDGDLIYGATAVAAIPEPSEYALMLAGLGMLGFMARRRLNNRV